MKWLTPTITKHFQIRTIWGANASSCTWSSGTPWNKLVKEGSYSGTDSPSGRYTAAWFAYFTVNVRPYTKLDENPSDNNIYLDIKIITNHNKIWTSNEASAGGFIDIGLIAWSPKNKPSYPNAVIDTTSTNLYLNDYQNALKQLYGYAGVTDDDVICGAMSDNGQKTGGTVPNGTWGSHPNGADSSARTQNFTLKFDESCFKDDGTLMDKYKRLPFYMLSRYRPDDSHATLAVTATIDTDLSIDPFIYIPWGIKKSTGWLSCNRNNNGLVVREKGSWSKIVKNSVLSRVINNKFPSSSDGYRVKSEKWNVSPITPPDD